MLPSQLLCWHTLPTVCGCGCPWVVGAETTSPLSVPHLCVVRTAFSAQNILLLFQMWWTSGPWSPSHLLDRTVSLGLEGDRLSLASFSLVSLLVLLPPCEAGKHNRLFSSRELCRVWVMHTSLLTMPSFSTCMYFAHTPLCEQQSETATYIDCTYALLKTLRVNFSVPMK